MKRTSRAKPEPPGVDWVSTPGQIEEDLRAERARENARSASDLRPGDQVTYSWGPETHCPVQWHSVTVGPFSATVTVCEGEAGHDAVARVKRVVARMVDEELERRIREHEARAAKNRPEARR